MKNIKRKSLPSEKTEWEETSFSHDAPEKLDIKTSDFGKLEKKVTFARLLNKVSAEMSSSSEPENSKSGTAKALSTPVSPAVDRKSDNVCSNQESDSLSSSEIAISGSAFNSLLDIPGNERKVKTIKNSSADSILEMFRSFTSTSVMTKGKKQTSSTTPTMSSPQEELNSDESAIGTPISTTSGPMDSPTDPKATIIEIPVIDALTAQKSNNFLQPPSILLEIPTTNGNNKFLSPIREMPTPVPTPSLTPTMPRINVKPKKIPFSSSDSSDNDNYIKKESEVIVHAQEKSNDEESFSSTTEDYISENITRAIEKNLTENSSETRRPNVVIPLLTVQEPSPPGSFPGSPPPQKNTDPFVYSPVGSPSRRLIKGQDKPNSLDLPFPPPLITITCNVSEPESDTEPTSSLKNMNMGTHNTTVNSVGMSYLSPFSMCSRADRTASESNLSSSGYSSMASPGPSRCGSNNPLCLSEVEDHHHQHAQNSSSTSERRSGHLRTPPNEESQHRGRSDSETLSDDPLLESNDEGIGTDHIDEKPEEKELKCVKDVEVFFGGDDKSGGQTIIDFGSLIVPNISPKGTIKKWENIECCSLGSTLQKASLQLPAIVVQADYCDKLLSPVSSRSESPLSDKAVSLDRFSPFFYSKTKCDNLPFTDSDGLYDFPSSDCHPSNNKSVQAGTNSHRKNTGRRRERRNSHRSLITGSKNSSPTKGKTTGSLLEVPHKETSFGHRIIAQRKPSPKRRIRTQQQQPLSSSSSTESLTSRKSLELKKIINDDNQINKNVVNPPFPGSNEASAEDTTEVIITQISIILNFPSCH